MDDNAIHNWLIECFGPVQGEMAWQQISALPDAIKDQLMSQNPDTLPKPDEVRRMMAAFTTGGLNNVEEMKQTVEEGPINIKLATSIAMGKATGDGSDASVSAVDGQMARTALSEANLWLDSACAFNPAPGEAEMLTRSGWVEGTLGAWAKFAAPVAQSMSDALASVFGERLGGEFGGEVTGMFAGPVPIPIPDGMKDPAQLMRLLGNTSFAMQLGQAAGALSHEVRGSFDQGIALLANPAGGLIVQNVKEYASSLEIALPEVLAFLSLVEAAHARLFASVPWLMPRFEALIGKYARGISIDLDAMEEQLRDAEIMGPESLSDAVNLTKVGIPDTPEQREALASLETLLALVEGWVDCVVWRAGMAHIPHLEQLREMTRRERAVGGPAERTFENLLGMQLRPRRMREAAALWESIGAGEGPDARDAKWSHPDLLPALPAVDGSSAPSDSAGNNDSSAGAASAVTDSADAPTGSGFDQADASAADSGTSATSDGIGGGIDWDAELSKLLDSEAGDNPNDDSDGNSGTPDSPNNAQ